MIFPDLLEYVFDRLPQYYEQAITSQIGQRVKRFYTETSKQVHDIHEEARHIAQAEKTSSKQTTVPGTGSGLDSTGNETVVVQ